MHKPKFIVAGLSLLALSAAVFLASSLTASAQPPDDRPRRPPEGRRGGDDDARPPRDREEGRRGGPPFGAMMGGGATMVAHGDHLFVLKGTYLYQISIKEMRVVKKMALEDDFPPFPPRGGDRDDREGPGGDRERPRPPKD